MHIERRMAWDITCPVGMRRWRVGRGRAKHALRTVLNVTWHTYGVMSPGWFRYALHMWVWGCHMLRERGKIKGRKICVFKTTKMERTVSDIAVSGAV